MWKSVDQIFVINDFRSRLSSSMWRLTCATTCDRNIEKLPIEAFTGKCASYEWLIVKANAFRALSIYNSVDSQSSLVSGEVLIRFQHTKLIIRDSGISVQRWITFRRIVGLYGDNKGFGKSFPKVFFSWNFVASEKNEICVTRFPLDAYFALSNSTRVRIVEHLLKEHIWSESELCTIPFLILAKKERATPFFTWSHTIFPGAVISIANLTIHKWEGEVTKAHSNN